VRFAGFAPHSNPSVKFSNIEEKVKLATLNVKIYLAQKVVST
jgi:hypothetical protein